MCCSGRGVPFGVTNSCGRSKSQKLLMSLEGTKLCGSFRLKADKLLAGWKKILPQKGAFEGSAHQRYCSL